MHRGQQGAPRKKREVQIVAKEVQVWTGIFFASGNAFSTSAAFVALTVSCCLGRRGKMAGAPAVLGVPGLAILRSTGRTCEVVIT